METRRLPYVRFATVTIVAIAAATVLNIGIGLAARAAGAPDRFPAFGASAITRLTVMFSALGALVFLGIVLVVKRRPLLVWRVVAYSAMVVSFIPDLRFFPAFSWLPTLPGFGGGARPGGPAGQPGGFNGTRTPPPGGFNGSGGPPPGGPPDGRAGGFEGGPPDGGFGGMSTITDWVWVLMLMHVVAGIVLTESLAWAARRAGIRDHGNDGQTTPLTE